jgi:glycosyltransferase involved in cell wall biosynthesis
VPIEKISLVYPGINLQEFSPSLHQHHDFRILYIGRFDQEKGLQPLLEAFSELCKERHDVELWIRGKKGSRELELAAKEYSRRLPIRFIPSSDYADLPRLYQDCDVLCLPSIDRQWHGLKIWEEQFGFVLIEAMACGLAVVGTDCGAIPEVVGPSNPIVPQNSSMGLLRELKRLCEDKQLRNTLSRKNRKRAEELFDIKKQRQAVEEELRELG